jgi:hypothetical protein
MLRLKMLLYTYIQNACLYLPVFLLSALLHYTTLITYCFKKKKGGGSVLPERHCNLGYSCCYQLELHVRKNVLVFHIDTVVKRDGTDLYNRTTQIDKSFLHDDWNRNEIRCIFIFMHWDVVKKSFYLFAQT